MSILQSCGPVPVVELPNSVLIARPVHVVLPTDVAGPLVEGGVGEEGDVQLWPEAGTVTSNS